MKVDAIKLDTRVTEDSRETLIDNEMIDEVVVSTYWDAHGKSIPWEGDDGKKSRSFKHVKVLLERVTKTYHFKHTGDSSFDMLEVFINGEKFNGDITSCKGNKKRLAIKACVGAG